MHGIVLHEVKFKASKRISKLACTPRNLTALAMYDQITTEIGILKWGPMLDQQIRQDMGKKELNAS